MSEWREIASAALDLLEGCDLDAEGNEDYMQLCLRADAVAREEAGPRSPAAIAEAARVVDVSGLGDREREVMWTRRWAAVVTGEDGELIAAFGPNEREARRALAQRLAGEQLSNAATLPGPAAAGSELLCDRCDGRGRLERGDYAYPCPECRGHGTPVDPEDFAEPDPPEVDWNTDVECRWDAPY